MDCRIIDSKIVVRVDSVVSVAPEHFDDSERENRYFGKVLRLIHDNKARIKWLDDNSVSVEDISDLKLETEVPPSNKKAKFQLKIKPQDQAVASDIDFTESSIPDNENITIHSSTPRYSTRKCQLYKNSYLEENSDENDSSNDYQDEKSDKSKRTKTKVLSKRKFTRGKKFREEDDIEDDSEIENNILETPPKKKPKRKKQVHGPATRRSPRKQIVQDDFERESSEDENILDLSDDDNNEYPVDPSVEKLESEKKIWNKEGWNIDPCERQVLGPRLLGMDSQNIRSEIDYIIHFLPINYITNTIIPATNDYAKKRKTHWESIDVDEFLHFLGILISMEVFEIHGPRRLYWNEEASLLFPGMNYGKIMSRTRFEDIVKFLQLSYDEQYDEQIIAFLDIVNKHFQSALSPGSYLTLDESMIKSFHHNLKGKIKIIRKPRPIGNEIKNLSDAASNIVLNMELYEGKEIMADKDYVKQLGATTATTLRLTTPYHGTGRRVIADSWFGSVKCAVALLEKGLYSIMLVKTAHKQFPRQLLSQTILERGNWVSYAATIDNIKVQACRFKDLKVKDFISTCSTIIPGNPRKTKHHGIVPRPRVAEEYLKYAASIDIHNHYRTGSSGLEDVWHTKTPQRRLLAGILGFCFTNSYLAMKYFAKPDLPHHQFKMASANALVAYKSANLYETRQLDTSIVNESILHELESIGYSLDCYYCNHGYDQKRRKTTSFKCKTCNIPICRPSRNQCWNLHITRGIPKKKYNAKRQKNK